jgi:prephenate dehydrogenase
VEEIPMSGPGLDKLVVVGVGLIGASFALALREAGAAREVVGVGRTETNLEEASRRGAIDRGHAVQSAWLHELADADLVLVATPVAQVMPLLERMAPNLGPRTVVTDAGSTKQDVVAAARATLGAALPRFVPAHPIAGSDRTGAVAGDAALFRDRQVIVTPLGETAADALALATAAWAATGARVSTLTPERHDRLLAAVSHLPHLLAFALVDVLAGRPDADEAFAHAGSGLRDVTRIAASSPEMWRDIVLANRTALIDELDAYRGALERIARALAERDGPALERLFAHAAAARRAWSASPTYPRVPASAGDDDA